MEAITRGVLSLIDDDHKLYSLHWLLSLSAGVNLLFVWFLTFIADCINRFNKPAGKAKQLEVANPLRYNYLRGIVCFRLLSYGLFTALMMKSLFMAVADRAFSWRFLVFPKQGMSVLEAWSSCGFYYAVLVLYNYSQSLILVLVLETLVQVLATNVLLCGVYVIALIFTLYIVRRADSRGIFGRCMWALLFAIAFHCALYVWRLYRQFLVLC